MVEGLKEILMRKRDMKKILQSIRFALRGLRHAYVSDKSFRMEVNYGLPIYTILGGLLFPFQSWEIVLYVFSYIIILVVELINTAFEKMLDRLHPEQHESIERSKDMAAAAVLMTFVFAAFIVGILIYGRICESVL